MSEKVPRLDANFFRPFVDGTLKTLEVSCQTKTKALAPFLKSKGEKKSFEIVGVIAINCKEFSGTITLCFGEELFLALMNRMLGENYTKLESELEDGAAEILNMIFGQAKIALNERGHKVQMAIPVVVRGQGLQAMALAKGEAIVLPFETDKGIFCLEISMKNGGTYV